MGSLYLDYAATTPVAPEVAKAMMTCLQADGTFGNPHSATHAFGWTAHDAVEEARAQIASAVGAKAYNMIFTSGATEANNLAIKGIAEFYGGKRRTIITSAIEHKAVLATCQYLEACGYNLKVLQPGPDALITPEQVAAVLDEDTLLVALMQVNNEIGTLTDIAKISQLTRANKTFLHVDAAQSLGKLPLDVAVLGADTLALSAHKCYGPKGMGALYVRREPPVRLVPQMHGGDQEFGLRSGTLATHQIVGFGVAAQMATALVSKEAERVAGLQKRLLETLRTCPGLYLNGNLEHSVPHITNISVAGVDGEALIMALQDLAISPGSACTSATFEPSYVLTALGRTQAMAHSAIRISLGRDVNEGDVDFAAETLLREIDKLRALSPVWDPSGLAPGGLDE